MKNRRNGVHNPDALFRTEVTAADVLASRLVCEPLRLWMLCSPDEGAAAVVLRRASDELRRHGGGGCAAIASPRGACWARPRRWRVWLTTASRRPRRLPRRAAYATAGVGPDELDVVECQDTDAARELLSYEELGLCGKGEAAQFLEAGAVEMTGRAAGEPERRTAVEGRAARRVGARPGGRAGAPAAEPGRAAPGRRRPGRARPTRSDAAPTRRVIILRAG